MEGLGDMGAGGSSPCDCSRKRPQALLANYHSLVMLKALRREPEPESWVLETVQQRCAWVSTHGAGHVSACARVCTWAGVPGYPHLRTLPAQ